MCFIMNVNYLFILYVLHSFSQSISNHHLHCKMLSAIYAEDKSLPYTIWLILRIFLLFCVCMGALYPDFGLTCDPVVYPPQFTALMFMDFVFSVIDILITLCMPRKLDVIKKERIARGSLLGNSDPSADVFESNKKRKLNKEKMSRDFETSSALSGVSSLDGEADFDLLNPERRKFRNDKEYFKYVRIQMWWNFLTALFIGCYECLIASMSVVPNSPYTKTSCIEGPFGKGGLVVWEADNAGSEIFIAMHPVLVVMSATFDYFVYFSIPYRLNRLKKSAKEIEEEEIY